MDYAELAENRVIAEPQLSPYHDLLIEYDWPHRDLHWQWVAQAPIEKLVAWAEAVRQNEADEAEASVADLVAWAEDIRRDEADEAEAEPATYSLSVPRTITAYPEQWDVVDRLAADKHHGKVSPAVREIIDAYDE